MRVTKEYFTGVHSVTAAWEKDPCLFCLFHPSQMASHLGAVLWTQLKLLPQTQSRTPSSVIIHSFVLCVTIVYVTVFPTKS